MFRDRKETFITGLKFNGHGNSVVGSVELHDYGDWETCKVEDGYQVVGVHALCNNLIRGIGFVLYNERGNR